jgi:hypothetical protein
LAKTVYLFVLSMDSINSSTLPTTLASVIVLSSGSFLETGDLNELVIFCSTHAHEVYVK